MRKFISISTAAVLVATSAAFIWTETADAQERQRVQQRQVQNVQVKKTTRVRKPMQDLKSIPVFKVVPGEPTYQYRESDLKMIQRVAPASKTMPNQQKAKLLKSNGPTPPPSGPGNVQNTPPPKITTLKLSTRNNYHGLGWLEFNETRHSDAKVDYTMWFSPMSGMGYMKAHLKFEKGERYLIDWSVGCDDKRDFHYLSTGGSQTTTLNEGEHHLLAIIEPQSSGWSSLMLWADTQWVFYGVEVSKM